MSNYTIKIPDIGEGITEVEIVEWFVQVGDTVAEDQNVASVMTDKVSVEISSPVQGRVMRLGGEAGLILAVGADLVEMEVAEVESASASAETLASEPDQTQTKSPPVETDSPPRVQSPPLVTTPGPMPQAESTPHQRLLQKVQASPAVRKRAASLSLDLNQLAQRLQKNHLNHADLDHFLSGNGAPEQFAPVGTITTIPLRGVRRQIAKKMLESTQNIPHFSYVEAVDVTELEAWRLQLNQQWAEQRGHLTLLPFLIRAMCLAIKEHPEVNARYDSAQNVVEQYTDVHMAIAIQTDEGLKVPVLQSAQQLGLWQMARKIVELAKAARAGQGDLQAKSTIGLSSLGALGGVMATPIINSPEVAIVGVNKQVRTPVVINDQIKIRTMMNLSSSFDHRIVDGMHAAQFIQTVRTLLEAPQIYLVD